MFSEFVKDSLFDEETMYMKGVRLELYPNIYQFELIRKFIEANDYFYNAIIYLEEDIYNKHIIDQTLPSFIGKFDVEKHVSFLRNEINMYSDVPLHICRGGAFRAIDAYRKYFRKITNKPRLKSAYNRSNSYSVRSDRFHFLGNCIKTEGISDIIYSHHHLFPEHLKIYKPMISIDPCNRVWLSFSYKENKETFNFPKSEPIGIDIGFRQDNSNTIVCSNGMIFNHPEVSTLKYNINRMNKICSGDNYRVLEESRKLGKGLHDIKLSNNIMKRRLRLNQLYARLHNIEENFINQTVAYLVGLNPEYICIEDLSTTQLQKQNEFIDFYYFSQFRFKTRIKDKCNIHGVKLYMVDNKEFPSSKICSRCGSIYDINRCSDNFNCPSCGFHINRDLNAAINLRNYPIYCK